MSRLLWYPGHDLLLPEIVRAENCHLHDASGKVYVDLESGVWCTSIGHGHPRLLRVLAEQPARIAHAGYCYSNPVVEESAQAVLDLIGFTGGRCVFLCSGSEAVEYGVRVARMVTATPVLMTMTDSYFGAYGSAADKRAEEWFAFDWMACAESGGLGCREGCEHWKAIPWDRIGGFLLEPGSSSGFVRFPPQELVQAIVREIRQRDGVVLVNEVTTGVGRTGEWFGYQHYGISPDIVALGKGIGNGYPVSVAALTPGVIERLGGRPIRYAQSHQNDPLGAAVVLEVIRVIQEEGLIARGREISTLLLDGLGGIQARTGGIDAGSDKIREIRARGLMVGLELEDDPACTRSARTYHQLLEQGYIVARRPGSSVFRIDPALTVERDDIRGFLHALEEILTGEGRPQ